VQITIMSYASSGVDLPKQKDAFEA